MLIIDRVAVHSCRNELCRDILVQRTAKSDIDQRSAMTDSKYSRPRLHELMNLRAGHQISARILVAVQRFVRGRLNGYGEEGIK